MATNLGNMFKLFSVAFQPPTVELAELLQSGALAADMRQTWLALELPEEAVDAFAQGLAEYEGADAQETLHAIRQDWSHLYLGNPPLVSNSEGVWRKKSEGRSDVARMINSYSVQVADFMRECGVRRKEKFNDCIDYIEEECDFCSFLADEPQYLIDLGRDPLALLQSFVDEHLAKWAPGFCADVQVNARSSYYRALATLMARFVEAF
ncbi:hypothetical protein AAY81_01265 [Denitrobacterium detoxificans]|uniref:Chaperone TorD involved in molybdoenzyme TorA maturation n=1 Tax=Denitrobacterium detoxificans TaxID=79604 RepID=A0A172RWJ5_9ACTN|nr:molecular chaperone TorD family protein [Denitrobacterium detoxificans]ANE22014.1 hypothetical protein AAY81_01265 [Denitrobacterium detoxificans]SEO96588.1 chaperone TorD involved in molybdoenzyme TorA maturation [Denitrobacterium detoxificans]